MRRWNFGPCVTSLVAIAAFAGAVPVRADAALPIQSNYESSAHPLTTEEVWKMAPEELNPHRVRWLLDRHLEWIGLQAVPASGKAREEGEYAVETAGLYARAVSYLRGAKDPAYSPISAFPCTKNPVAWFATFEGTRLAANAAEKIWDRLLTLESIRLAIYLRHARGDDPDGALHSAQEALARWRDGLDKDWQDKVLVQVRADEWKYYRKQAQAAGVCRGKMKAATAAPRWESLLEPVPKGGAPKLLARAPARRWGGLFSVLVSLKIDKLELVGKFLIDSAAPESVIDPTFLQNQGALASWITRGIPRRIEWSGGSGVAIPAYVEEAKVAGLVLPIHDFYLHETDFFGPPESFAACCDGILGSDFLRQYAVELRPGRGPEVNIYAREGFHPEATEPWIESHFDAGGEVVSDCAARPHSAAGSPQARGPELRGARWDTGSEEALQFEREPGPEARRVAHWDLSCGPLRMANALAIEPVESDSDQVITGLIPLDVGMPLLGRGDFTFDLSHGRIWFNPQGLVLPVVQNHSGLRTEFVFVDGDRALKVVSIRKGSAAESLADAGLRPGMTLLSLNGKSADEMDTWEVDQRLAGVFGRKVAVEWQTGRRREGHHWASIGRTAQLQLPPESQ